MVCDLSELATMVEMISTLGNRFTVLKLTSWHFPLISFLCQPILPRVLRTEPFSFSSIFLYPRKTKVFLKYFHIDQLMEKLEKIHRAATMLQKG